MNALLRRVRKLSLAFPYDPVAELDRLLQTDEDWLALYEEGFRRGEYKNEPEFPEALQRYRDAMTTATTWRGEPFEPPDNFMPTEPLRDRQIAWRKGKFYDAVGNAFAWLGTYLHRVTDKKPPILRREFEELAAWFTANEAVLKARMTIEESQVVLQRHRFNILQGWYDSRMNETIEGLRILRKRFADVGEPTPSVV